MRVYRHWQCILYQGLLALVPDLWTVPVEVVKSIVEVVVVAFRGRCGVLDVPCFEYKAEWFLDIRFVRAFSRMEESAYRVVITHTANRKTMRATLFSCFRLSTFVLLVVLAFS